MRALVIVAILMMTASPATAARLPRQITGYRSYQFDLPCSQLSDYGVNYSIIQDVPGVSEYLGDHRFALRDCSVSTMVKVLSLGQGEGVGYIDAVLVTITPSDLVRDSASPLPTMYEVAQEMSATLRASYDGRLIGANETGVDRLGNPHLYLYLHDEDNNSLWLKLEYNTIELGYMSSYMREAHGSVNSR